MIIFHQDSQQTIFATHLQHPLEQADLAKLSWLYGNAELMDQKSLEGKFIGPRKEMITPWSTNAVEISQNMAIVGILRIERFFKEDKNHEYDPMLNARYSELTQAIFTIEKNPEPILEIDNISKFNQEEGLALSDEEITYLEGVSQELGRKLTDSEVFGFSQVNSEHCRHKIFNGVFIINGKEKKDSLFTLIKKTAKANPNRLVSAYKDNVAFVKGPKVEQFAPETQHKPDYFRTKPFDSVISLKAETHNFPTTVEPFNGAATGSGGEIRDRLAGGTASFPLAGTAVYMTSYSRLEEGRNWEKNNPERNWLYQSPIDILIKASNGASDFGNKFGQPLICGSVLTFEHQEKQRHYGFDKVIMLAGGIGYGKFQDSQKNIPEVGDKVIVLGGDNYRIGMGGGAVSSVATGEFTNSIELNAVQRSNPEMQKRVANAIRAMGEMDENPIVSIHDHGAGGHLNCLSELLEETGGIIEVNKLPVGDPTLSSKEIIGNESQERMGLILKKKDIEVLRQIAERERAPMYEVGTATGDMNLAFKNENGQDPINWKLEHMFGSSPKTIIKSDELALQFEEINYDPAKLKEYIQGVLQLEAVASKDWLTNKVDRSVTGKVATQQTTGEIQLPLNNVAVMALDFNSNKGIATSIGHAPVAALVDPVAGSQLAIAESLTNMVWAPIEDGLAGVSLSANWMWPAKTPGEDARLYAAVEAVSDFAIALGLNIPTGKDSLSMAQKYPDGNVVYSPGTVIISSVGEVKDIRKTISPSLKSIEGSSLIYISFGSENYHLGGSSFAQYLDKIGTKAPSIKDAEYFKNCFETIQFLIEQGRVLSGHDISSGGLITTLLEMNFPNLSTGASFDLSNLGKDLIKILFSESPAIVIQVEDSDSILNDLNKSGINAHFIGNVNVARDFTIKFHGQSLSLNIDELRDTWYKPSFLLDCKQTNQEHGTLRFKNYKHQALAYNFDSDFSGQLKQYDLDLNRKNTSGLKAAIIREKGVNGDREMAYALYLAGFDVKDVHMTDLITGREDLADIHMIVFVGGFSNSDVLGSAKGWAGAFLYNKKAKETLNKFFAREDTLSLGVCNGCQLSMELGLIYENMDHHPKMKHNNSRKFESAFVNVSIQPNNSVMFGSMEGDRLGVWIAHGEGKFELDGPEENFNIIAKYSHEEYPANPNGSDYSTAFVSSTNGRHVALMPHIERSLFPWNWPDYPTERNDEISPWIEAFVNAKEWVKSKSIQ